MLFTAIYQALAEDILSLLTTAGSAMTSWLTIFTTAIKNAFLNLLYDDPTATEKSISGIMLYLFVFFGVNVIVGIVWFIISLAKRRGN